MMHYLTVAAIGFVFLCHAKNMDRNTPLRAKIQHGGLMLFAVASLPVYDFGPWVAGLGALWYAAFDARNRYYRAEFEELPVIDGSLIGRASGGKQQ